MRSWLALLLVSASVLGCEVKKRQSVSSTVEKKDAAGAKPVSADVAALRQDVIANVRVWGRTDYTPTEPALIDPIVERTLETSRHPDNRNAVVQEAADRVAAWLSSNPDGQAVLEKKLAERYNKPVITRDGDLVRIDLGIIAGKPRQSRGLGVTSRLAENGSHGLILSEVVRNIEAGRAAHPDARTYQLEVDIPGMVRSRDGYTYVYNVDEDRIRLYIEDKRDHYYRTKVLGRDLASAGSLVWTNMERLPMDRPPIRSVDLHKP